MRYVLLGAALVAGLAMSAPKADAAPFTISGSVGGAPTGVSYETFNALPLGSGGGLLASGITVGFQPNAQAVQGAVTSQYAAPFLSGNNGAAFGGQPNGADATTYLTSGSTGATANAAITLILPGLEQYFGLLWGSVDDYNTLSFYNGATLVGSITGSDVTGSPNGDQGVNGTLYVNINSTVAFDRVVATSTQFAFEFDNVAFNPTAVPEPASLALLGSALLGFGLVRRRRRG